MLKIKPRLGMPRRLHERARWAGAPRTELASKAVRRAQGVGR
jgi:hypothetical protein